MSPDKPDADAIMQMRYLDKLTVFPSLRRRLGGRLRTYRPNRGQVTRLDSIRKALVRGELVLNAFNRWQLLKNQPTATHWTFADPGQTGSVIAAEGAIAQREASDIAIAFADELNAEEITNRIDAGPRRPDLLLARRDWSLHPAEYPWFLRMIRVARQHGIVVHVVAAFGSQANVNDELLIWARQRCRLQREPIMAPAPRTSNIERRFGEHLKAAGFDPVPQMPVAHYFLDFAVTSSAANGVPVRLDVEVDGRPWHEELPGRHGIRDERRDQVMKRLGWRPIRLWSDDIDKDESRCLERIRREAASPTPLSTHEATTMGLEDDE